MSSLDIRLLGEFQLLHKGELVTGLYPVRLQSLLAYLLLHCLTPQSRRQVAYLFWPDSTEAQALTNLRRELHYLRHALPEADQFLIVGTQSVQWQANGPYTLDLALFERTLAEAKEVRQAGQVAKLCALLAKAVDLYAGDLLPSCYDEWILNDRERLHLTYGSALEELAQLYEEQAQYRNAIQACERLLRHDPIHEIAYQRLMRLYLLNGDRAHALRTYYSCAAILRRELDVEPSTEMHRLYEQLLKVDAAPEPVATQSHTVERATLVARQKEWEILQNAWRRAYQDKIHFVLISGEAGIGKTRLAEELLQWAGQHAIPVARTRSYAAEGRLAYAPVVEWLRSDALQGIHLSPSKQWLGEVARLLPEVIEVHPEIASPGPLTESWQRLRFFEGLARAVLLGSQPLLLLIDDLQWCDQDTLEWLRYLMRFVSGATGQPQNRERIVVIGTARSEEIGSEHSLWNLVLELRNSGQLSEIELGPLNESESNDLALAIAGHAFTPEQMGQLYRDTQGNPLFIVETLRSSISESLFAQGKLLLQVEHSSEIDSHKLVLPPKIYAVIHSRLAQLSLPARELVGIAATIGRSFTFALLAKVSGSDEIRLMQGLDELWQRRILREHGANEYDFCHDRIRDVAYMDNSPVRRRLLHRQVAQALEVVFDTELDSVSGQIATHYVQAGLVEPAIAYFERAASVAQRIYAHGDAVANLNKALALLRQLSLTPERRRQELKLLLDLGISLGPQIGFAAPAMKELYERAQALALEVGDGEQRLMVNSGLFSNFLWRRELSLAQTVAEQGILLAQRMSDPIWLADAHGRLGVVCSYQGRWQASRLLFEEALSINEPESRSRPRLEAASQYPVVLYRRFLANNLWDLGYPDQALAHMQLALAQAHKLAHPYTLATTIVALADHYLERRDLQNAQIYVESAVAFSQQHSFPLILTSVQMLLGRIQVQQGKAEAGIMQMLEAMETLVARGHEAHRPAYSMKLAEAYVIMRRPNEGLALVAEALAQTEANNQFGIHSELYRLMGELLHIRGATRAEVESHFQKAIIVAQEQEAKSLELRAALSLSLLWQQQGHFSAARELLAPLYAWFAEGFDSPDLQDAKALLAKLS